MRHRLNQLLVVGLLCVIVVLSLIPVAPPQPGTAPTIPWSMLFHAGMYFLLAGSLLLVFHDTPRGHLEAIAVAAGIGLILEMIQYQLPFRTFAIKDAVLNTAGAGLIVFDHQSTVVETIIEMEDSFLERFYSR
ncbi:MAG: VanZ family protein [Candidatus Nanohaloarchaeota archaeon QJJ-5]|nr:VanZ family protein [Candidatus Nanohaloarchaeota archaeon QJJ-5]